jgi:hypothetical protein
LTEVEFTGRTPITREVTVDITCTDVLGNNICVVLGTAESISTFSGTLTLCLENAEGERACETAPAPRVLVSLNF